MRISVLLALSLAAGTAGCGSSTAGSTTKEPEGGGERALCVDPKTATGSDIPLAQAGQPGVIGEGGDDKGVSAALEPGWTVHAVVDTSAGHQIAVIARTDCNTETPCEPHIVAVGGGKVAARTPLAQTQAVGWGPTDPFAVEWMVVQQSDSGAGDVWLSYAITSPPEPAVGSTTTSHVALVSLPALTARWSGVHATIPEAGVNEHCLATLSSVDADCDGLNDLILATTCQLGMCVSAPADEPPPECEGGPSIERALYIQNTDRTFAERPPDRSPAPERANPGP